MKWAFDRERFVQEYRPDDHALIAAMSDPPIVEVMAYIGQFVVGGPVEVDWADPYGFTMLSQRQLVEVCSDFLDAIHGWLAELSSQ